MKSPSAKEIIKREYSGGSNMITREITGYGKIDSGQVTIAWELSEGRDILDWTKTLYAVCFVVWRNGQTARYRASSGLHGSPEAREETIERVKALGLPACDRCLKTGPEKGKECYWCRGMGVS